MNGLPPLAPAAEGSDGSGSPARLLKKEASLNNRKGHRSMRLNFGSNSVQFDTSTIIDNFLYLGAKGVTSDRDKLETMGISYILNVSEDPPVDTVEGVEYMQVEVADDPSVDIARHFLPAIEYISKAKKQRKSVLVHCTMGMSRSCSLVLAYLMAGEGMTLAQALIHTKERRPVASPNPGFMTQLIELEKQTFGKATIDIERYSKDRFGEVSQYLLP